MEPYIHFVVVVIHEVPFPWAFLRSMDYYKDMWIMVSFFYTLIYNTCGITTPSLALTLHIFLTPVALLRPAIHSLDVWTLRIWSMASNPKSVGLPCNKHIIL